METQQLSTGYDSTISLLLHSTVGLLSKVLLQVLLLNFFIIVIFLCSPFMFLHHVYVVSHDHFAPTILFKSSVVLCLLSDGSNIVLNT